MLDQETYLVHEAAQTVPAFITGTLIKDLDRASLAISGHDSPYLTVAPAAERLVADYRPLAKSSTRADRSHDTESSAF
jgi:hypothetical protein